jgi:hypothetical protein
MCGKSFFVNKLLQNHDNIFHPKAKHIYWHYSEVAPNTKLNNIEYIKGLPEPEQINEYSIIVIDDLMVEIGKNNEMANLFTRVAHHRTCLIIYITQNLYHNAKNSRTIALNTHILILFKSPRDKTFIHTLARQMQLKYLPAVFEEVTKLPYTYLYIDLFTDTDDDLRIRSNILFENGKYINVYKQLG